MESAYLVIVGPQGVTQLNLAEGYIWKVGRHEENDVVISSHIVSREHAMLQRAEDGTFHLIDMGSRNGSFVNGRRVSVPVALNDGDQITLGDTVIKFRRHTNEIVATAPARVRSGDTTISYFASNRITVLVIDVRNFTVLTQQIDQGQLCQVIGTWFREAGPVLNAQGSWAQKYIGDAIMSIWVHEHGSRTQEMVQILRTLVDLVRMTATLQERFGLEEAVRIGAGINTGLATIGNAGGSGSLTDYTAMGDTVNATFRLESATRETGVDLLLGKESFEWLAQLVRSERYFTPVKVKLKGYSEPVAAWGANFADLEKFIECLPGA